MSNLINGFEKKVVAKIVDKILSCDKNERRNYLLKLVSVNVNEKVYHLTLNLFTTLTAN